MAMHTQPFIVPMNLKNETMCCLNAIAVELTKFNQTDKFLYDANLICGNLNITSSPFLFHFNYTEALMYKNVCVDVDKCKMPTTKMNLGYIGFWIILLGVILSVNSFFCAAAFYSRNLLKVPSHRFILSLAVSDILVAIVAVPMRIKSALHNHAFCSSNAICHLAFFTDHLVFFSAILILFAIGVDRYIAVSKPYKYTELMSKKRANTIIATIWIVGAMFGFLANIDWRTLSFNGVTAENLQCTIQSRYYNGGIMIVGYFVPLILMGFVYYKIFRITLKHVSLFATIGDFRENIGLKEDDENSKRRSSLLSNKVRKQCQKISCSTRTAKLRACRVVFIVYGTFVVCWLPGNIATLVYLYTGWVWEDWCVHLFNEVLPLLNSVFNVFLYALMNEDCKMAMKKLLHCCKICPKRINKKPISMKSQRRGSTKSVTVISQLSDT